MFEFLTPNFGDFFRIKDALASFLQSYYSIRENEGEEDFSWQSFKEDTVGLESSISERAEDLIRLYARDASKSYSTLTAGNLVVFSYTSLKYIKKAYFAIIVATKNGNGVYGNINTKNDLMSCFLIDSGTDLNTMASVVNVLHSMETRKQERAYQSLENEKSNRDVRKDAGNISPEGMQALFPTTEFRTFRLNLGMHSLYKLNLDG